MKEFSALVNRFAKDLSSELLRAAERGDPERLREALAAGADPYQKERWWPGKTAADHAAERGEARCLEELLKAGWNPNKPGYRVQSPAHYAAQRGQEACLKLLLDAGMDPNEKGMNGWTLGHCAAAGGHEGCLRILLERGLDLSVPDRWGRSVLDVSMEGLNADFLEAVPSARPGLEIR